MKIKRVNKKLFALLCATLVSIVSGAVEVASSTMKVVLSAKDGTISRIVSKGGAEFGVETEAPLFLVSLCKTNSFTDVKWGNARQAKKMTVQKVSGGVNLVYEEVGEVVDKVVCSITSGSDDKIRWGITVYPKAGWAVNETYYPRFPLARKLGSVAEDDGIVLGHAKGGIERNPSQRKGLITYAKQPGQLVAQFGTYYDDMAGFYFAAEDGAGYAKYMGFASHKDCIIAEVRRIGFATCEDKQLYDVVCAAYEGTAANPATWHDAADIYKKWAVTQKWCSKLLRDREDLPKWMRDAPSMVRFGRNWLADSDSIRDWVKNYWQKNFPSSPLLVAFWGWEKVDYWITPEYFPVYPDNEKFTDLVRDLRKENAHSFPWPSGYHWTLLYDKKADGSFVWDDRKRFENVKEHAVYNRDGKMYIRTPSWLRGGNCACMCGGDPWTIHWWNNDICLPLVKMGCEMIQVDQVVGGAFPECWARNHPHTPGEGKWKTDCFREQLVTMRDMMLEYEKDSVVCFEEPNEHFNDIVGIQDYRNCEIKKEWASVFNYIYHEYVPPFQSNPRRGNRIWQAHQAADGQMPHFVPVKSEIAKTNKALGNGDFEKVVENKFAVWSRTSGHAGETWTGKWAVDEKEKKSGSRSLRLESSSNDFTQVAQNVSTSDSAFIVGEKYRVTAWVKSGKSPKNCNFSFGVFASGLKRLEGGKMNFPEVGKGWQFVSADFIMPENSEMIRFMINAGSDSVVWVDDVRLMKVNADGSAQDVILVGISPYDEFMKNWVTLYHGEGREWLAFGRHIKPPRIVCNEVEYENVKFPCVFHAAYEAKDGRKALVLANATRSTQKVSLLSDGKRMTLVLSPDEIKLIAYRPTKK